MIRASLFTLALLSALGTLSARADETTDAIRDNLQKSSPNLKVKSIQPSQIPGLYEVFASGSIFYVDKSATYVLANGTMYEIATKRNLTGERLQSLSTIQFDTLPFKDSIEIKKGSGAYRFAVFTDPDCPYCQRLEQSLEKSGVSDYTMHVFLMPLESLHKEARWKAEAVWCSADRATAWSALMLKRTAPEKATCPNPVDATLKLAESIGISGTPSIYLNDGSLTNDPQELIAAIKKGAAK